MLERSLAAGHHVKALVRNPAALTIASDQLQVFQGDATDRMAVRQTVAGSDAVLNLIGHVKGSPKTLQADATRAMIDAMKTHEITRIITLSGGGLRGEQSDRPGPMDAVMRFLLKTMAGHVLDDSERHLEVLKESGLEWTVVRGPRLTERPGKGSYRVGWVGVDTGMQISRDELADFILTQVDDRAFIHRMPFVTE